MCVVLCVSIVFGVGMFDRQENGSLSGWNPSSAYNTLSRQVPILVQM